ncbi:hypothetical protein [Kitasatospora purpeofusca]|nr:hypothetical protein [Kitasatospora purpeofusca]
MAQILVHATDNMPTGAGSGPEVLSAAGPVSVTPVTPAVERWSGSTAGR